jgi:ethanolamine ammonia-lyase small subunit
MNDIETRGEDPWHILRQWTDARIALGRSGSSLLTKVQLDFQWAQARARDAVHHPLAVVSLKAELENLLPDVHLLQSAAKDRRTYLQRPDLGRLLSEDSRQHLASQKPLKDSPDLVLVIADGLSALAIERQALRFLGVLLPALKEHGLKLAPICIVEQGRVAIGDDIGEILGAKMVAVLIGERPGLSSPDSMGIYLSWQPRVGMQDSARNCLSNIRAQGMSDEVAVKRLMFLITEAMRRNLTGVALKDESLTFQSEEVEPTRRFIL